MLLELAYGCCPYKPHETATTTALKTAVTNGALLHRVRPPHTHTPNLQPQTPSSRTHTAAQRQRLHRRRLHAAGGGVSPAAAAESTQSCPVRRVCLHAEASSASDSEAECVAGGQPDVCAGGVSLCCVCVCGLWWVYNSWAAQDERMFLEQEHDERANTLATRVVTTGGVMQVW